MADILTSELQLSSGGDVLKLAPQWDNIQNNRIMRFSNSYGIKVTKPKSTYWYDGASFKLVESYGSTPNTWQIVFRWVGNAQMDGTYDKGARYVRTATGAHNTARSLRVFVSEDTTNYYCYFIWMSAATGGSASTTHYSIVCDDQLNPSSFTVLSTAPTIADLTEVPWYFSKRTLVNGSVDASDITSGTLPIARGGTGATTAAAALTNLIKGSNDWTTPTDTESFGAINAAQNNSGRYTFKELWDNYLQAKAKASISYLNPVWKTGTTVTSSNSWFRIARIPIGGYQRNYGGVERRWAQWAQQRLSLLVEGRYIGSGEINIHVDSSGSVDVPTTEENQMAYAIKKITYCRIVTTGTANRDYVRVKYCFNETEYADPTKTAVNAYCDVWLRQGEYNTTSIYQLGKSSDSISVYPWASGCIHTAPETPDWTYYDSDNVFYKCQFGVETYSANILPAVGDGTGNIGSTTVRWSNIYANNVTSNLTGNVTGNCSGSSGSCTGNSATASAAKSGSALETSINGKVTSNASITGATKCKITYDSKGLVTAGADITSKDVAPIYTKTFENVLATAADTNNANFYFGKITPDGNSIYKQWRIRYRLYADLHDPTAIPSTDTDKGNNVYVKGWFDVEVNFRGEGNTTYKIWNNHSSTSYRSVTYHLVGRAKNAYITSAGYHLLGIRTRDAYKPISTGWGRDYRVEILEMEGCTFEFYDTIQKHSAVYTSNYVGLSEFDGVNNGLRESGDDNSYDTICNGYTAFVVGTGGLKQYSICAIDSTGKIQSFTTTSGTGTSKTVNTAKFRFPLTLFRYNQGTDRASGYYFKEWNWMDTQRSNLDSRYSCNRGSVFNGNSGPVYIEGEVGSDGLFTVSNNILTQTFVAGKVYVHIGNTYGVGSASTNTYAIEFSTQHPCFYYDGTNLIPYEHSLYLEPSDTVLTVDCIDITL